MTTQRDIINAAKQVAKELDPPSTGSLRDVQLAFLRFAEILEQAHHINTAFELVDVQHKREDGDRVSQFPRPTNWVLDDAVTVIEAFRRVKSGTENDARQIDILIRELKDLAHHAVADAVTSVPLGAPNTQTQSTPNLLREAAEVLRRQYGNSDSALAEKLERRARNIS